MRQQEQGGRGIITARGLGLRGRDWNRQSSTLSQKHCLGSRRRKDPSSSFLSSPSSLPPLSPICRSQLQSVNEGVRETQPAEMASPRL